MPTVRCPDCEHRFRVDDADVGRTVECPACAAEVVARPAADDRPRQPPKRKSRLGLILGLAAAVVVVGLGGCGVIGYFVFRAATGSSTASWHRIEAPDGAWAVKLPGPPQTHETKDTRDEYVYAPPGQDAEFRVQILESKGPNPDGEGFELTGGLMLMGIAQKYNLGDDVIKKAKVQTSKYDGTHARRLYYVDAGARGQLTVQLVAANWSTGRSTVVIQTAIGKEVSQADRTGFHQSIEIKKDAR